MARKSGNDPVAIVEVRRPLRVPAGFTVLMIGSQVKTLRDPRAATDQAFWPLLFAARRRD